MYDSVSDRIYRFNKRIDETILGAFWFYFYVVAIAAFAISRLG